MLRGIIKLLKIVIADSEIMSIKHGVDQIKYIKTYFYELMKIGARYLYL